MEVVEGGGRDWFVGRHGFIECKKGQDLTPVWCEVHGLEMMDGYIISPDRRLDGHNVFELLATCRGHSGKLVEGFRICPVPEQVVYRFQIFFVDVKRADQMVIAPQGTPSRAARYS